MCVCLCVCVCVCVCVCSAEMAASCACLASIICRMCFFKDWPESYKHHTLHALSHTHIHTEAKRTHTHTFFELFVRFLVQNKA